MKALRPPFQQKGSSAESRVVTSESILWNLAINGIMASIITGIEESVAGQNDSTVTLGSARLKQECLKPESLDN